MLVTPLPAFVQSASTKTSLQFMKPTAKSAALVFLGGALGTWGRWFIAEASQNLLVTTNEFAHYDQVLAATIVMLFAVNLFGAGFLGFSNNYSRWQSDLQRAFWGIGFAGGFTTMSGVALWMYHRSFSPDAIALTIAMFALGIWAYRLGAKWAR